MRPTGTPGELAHLLGHDGEATALLADASGLDGGVEGQQVGLLGDSGDRVDDFADLLALGVQRADRGGRLGAEARTARIASVAWNRLGALLSQSAACAAASAVCCAPSADACETDATSSVRCLASAIERTWSSAPSATEVTAWAISPTARPASSEVLAICCEAEAMCSEVRPIAWSISATLPRVVLYPATLLWAFSTIA